MISHTQDVKSPKNLCICIEWLSLSLSLSLSLVFVVYFANCKVHLSHSLGYLFVQLTSFLLFFFFF